MGCSFTVLLNPTYRTAIVDLTESSQSNLGLLEVDMSNESKHVIIVGAGASGIAAARVLVNNPNVSLQILEARERYGGRLFQKDFGGVVCDLGNCF